MVLKAEPTAIPWKGLNRETLYTNFAPYAWVVYRFIQFEAQAFNSYAKWQLVCAYLHIYVLLRWKANGWALIKSYKTSFEIVHGRAVCMDCFESCDWHLPFRMRSFELNIASIQGNAEEVSFRQKSEWFEEWNI